MEMAVGCEAQSSTGITFYDIIVQLGETSDMENMYVIKLINEFSL